MPNKLTSQVILETLAGLMVIFLLLAGVTKLFVWFSNSFAGRQIKFEQTRQIGAKIARADSCTMGNPDSGACGDGKWGYFSCTGGNLQELTGQSSIDPSGGLSTARGDAYAQYVSSFGTCKCNYKCDWAGCCNCGCTYKELDCGEDAGDNWRGGIQSCTYTNAVLNLPSGGILESDVQDLNYTAPHLNLTD